MTISANELLSLGATELPTKEITLKGGSKIKIRALDGLQRLENFGKPMAEQVEASIRLGLVEPQLSPKQRIDFIKRNYSAAGEIFREICDLNASTDSAVQEEEREAEKNSESARS